jgi:parallel beta-helix repeat protein
MTGGFNDSLFTDNTITGGQNGIRSLAILRSVVSGNIISDCGLDALVFPSAYGVVLRNNTVTNTTGCGIMTSGNDAVIEGNTVIDSTISGIYLAFGDNGTISHNIVSNSLEYGLKLGGSSSNTSVSENSFIDNVGTSSQILDDGENNLIRYNHYSDWITPDSNADGIVDNEYSCDGEASNSDPYPIVDSSGSIPTPTEYIGIPVDLLLITGAGILVVIIIVVLILKRR